MSRVTDDELLREATEATDLPGKLSIVASRNTEIDPRWLHTMVYTEGDVCLRCDMGEAELFFRWAADSLVEIECRSGDPLSGPQTTDPVRTIAAIESANSIVPVWVWATPFEEP